MSYFAKIENGLVTQVIVADQAFVSSQPGTWVETAMDGSIRKNYAGQGYTYDSVNDAFVSPKPAQFPSWVLNTTTYRYNPPVAKPTDGQMYVWTEATVSWTVVPAPYPSWVLTNGAWTPPVAYPTDGKRYQWNEPTVNWVLLTP